MCNLEIIFLSLSFVFTVSIRKLKKTLLIKIAHMIKEDVGPREPVPAFLLLHLSPAPVSAQLLPGTESGVPG